jgi:hypothetical protein
MLLVLLFEVETVTEKLKGINCQVGLSIKYRLIKAESKILRPEIHKLVHSIWNKYALAHQWKESIIVSIYKREIKTD